MIKIKKRNSINFFSFLFCLLPAALISGPFLSDLIICCIAIFFMYISIKEKNWSYYKNIYVYFFILFYSYILIGSLISVSPLNSLESSLFYFRYLFFSLGVIYLLNNKKNLKTLFAYALFFTILIVVLDAYLQFFTGTNSIGYPKWANGRLSGFLKDESLGRYLVYLTPLIFAMIMLKNEIKKYEIISVMILLVLVFIIIYLTGERTSFILLILASAVIVLNISKFKYLISFCLILSILVAIFFTIYNPNVKSRIIDQSISDLDIANGDIKIINMHYDSIFKSAYKIFLDNPIIGIGVKNYRIVCKNEKYLSDFSCSTHPHNTLLQFLSETGLIGTFFYILSFSLCGFVIIRNFYGKIFNNREFIIDDYQICLYAALLIILWPIAPSLNFFNNWISILYYLPVPFLLQKKLFNK